MRESNWGMDVKVYAQRYLQVWHLVLYLGGKILGKNLNFFCFVNQTGYIYSRF